MIILIFFEFNFIKLFFISIRIEFVLESTKIVLNSFLEKYKSNLKKFAKFYFKKSLKLSSEFNFSLEILP